MFNSPLGTVCEDDKNIGLWTENMCVPFVCDCFVDTNLWGYEDHCSFSLGTELWQKAEQVLMKNAPSSAAAVWSWLWAALLQLDADAGGLLLSTPLHTQQNCSFISSVHEKFIMLVVQCTSAAHRGPHVTDGGD